MKNEIREIITNNEIYMSQLASESKWDYLEFKLDRMSDEIKINQLINDVLFNKLKTQLSK